MKCTCGSVNPGSNSLRPAPQINVSPQADGNNAISDHSDCFGFWILLIYRVNGSVSYNQSCRRFRLRVCHHSGHNYQDTKREFTFHNCDECRGDNLQVTSRDVSTSLDMTAMVSRLVSQDEWQDRYSRIFDRRLRC